MHVVVVCTQTPTHTHQLKIPDAVIANVHCVWLVVCVYVCVCVCVSVCPADFIEASTSVVRTALVWSSGLFFRARLGGGGLVQPNFWSVVRMRCCCVYVLMVYVAIIVSYLMCDV